MNLKEFFENKNLTNKVYEMKDKDGNLHIIHTDRIIKDILTTRGDLRKKIKDTLVKIDFANGDVHHFLKHLAESYTELGFQK